MRVRIITNNPLVKEKWGEQEEVDLIDGPIEAVFQLVRDEIHRGAVLLTHPLSGSVRPVETPYKSILLSLSKGDLHLPSVLMIEKAMNRKLVVRDVRQAYDAALLQDFQRVDASLVESALASAGQGEAMPDW